MSFIVIRGLNKDSVISYQGCHNARIHDTENEALEEAFSLALKMPNDQFWVMEVLGGVKALISASYTRYSDDKERK